MRPSRARAGNLTPEMRNTGIALCNGICSRKVAGYRYDFFFDNCATRILDAFDTIFPEKVDWHLKQRNLTFRNYIDQYLTGHPFSDYGIDLALGAKTDRIATPRGNNFLPGLSLRSLCRRHHSG